MAKIGKPKRRIRVEPLPDKPERTPAPPKEPTPKKDPARRSPEKVPA